MLFITTYQSGKTRYGSHIWADSDEEFYTLLSRRNLPKEHLEYHVALPENRHVSEMGTLPKNLDLGFAHYLMFLGYVAICSGKKPIDIFSDVGICHEAIHWASAVLKRDNFALYLSEEESNQTFTKWMDKVIALAVELGLLPKGYSK